ncbi:FBA_3 domain-containing protein [Cephalotus follicularis]|uniref:FBA_3 domain-containing protein n=1 Tax=Cephalotus follicularis TaxID=3775 RepID=A0A1Q3C9M7_CEPFO|nr:FBA_3 domain-containing protein [Cephalotus follicularis]
MALIPDSLILEFLLRLPLKSLVRFKCIDKFWYSLISHLDFIYTQLNRAKSENNRCLMFSCLLDHDHQHSAIQFFSIKDNHEPAVLEHIAPVSLDSYHVLPSCNGLVCFYGSHSGIHVCNPSTRNLMTLLDGDSTRFRLLSCGFGFDQRSRTYKVIKITQPLSVDNDFKIEVLTMSPGGWWRTVRYKPHFRFLNRQAPVFASGYFYWITSDATNGNSGSTIVKFDVENEVFGIIYPPESISLKNWHMFNLVELGGELCLVDLDFELENKRRMDIWFLKGSVKDHQWVQETIVHQSEPLDATRPVAFHGGEILVYGFIKGLDYLNWYNLQTRLFRPLKTIGIPSPYSHVSAHVESLVPLITNDDYSPTNLHNGTVFSSE